MPPEIWPPGVTLTEVARAAHLSIGTVCRWRQGQRRLSPDALGRVRHALVTIPEQHKRRQAAAMLAEAVMGLRPAPQSRDAASP
jgi:transcriptional regulator with XRE-family HTH domain